MDNTERTKKNLLFFSVDLIAQLIVTVFKSSLEMVVATDSMLLSPKWRTDKDEAV